MARVFVTGSSDGLGRMAASLLIQQGHKVVLHARNSKRSDEAAAAVPGADGIVVGDLASIEEMRSVASQVNERGNFDAVIHNAAVGYRETHKIVTPDGLSHVFAINSLAPYVLTALIKCPQRLVYLSSGLHRSGDPTLEDLNWQTRAWRGEQAFADSKLHVVLLAFAVARLWPDVFSNSLEPGWVPTKMGGPSAPDDLDSGHQTQVWLAASNDRVAQVTGEYFYHMRLRKPSAATRDITTQNKFLKACQEFSGIDISGKS